MGDVLTFTPRSKPVTGNIASEPLAGAALRASLEEAAQTALDAADRIIAVLDRMDGDADDEDGGDAEPSLAAPENTAGSQVVYMRGGDQDREAEVPETVLPLVTLRRPVMSKASTPARSARQDESFWADVEGQRGGSRRQQSEPKPEHSDSSPRLISAPQDEEAEAPEVAAEPIVASAPEPIVIAVPPLRWGGRGNVIAATGSFLVDLLERA